MMVRRAVEIIVKQGIVELLAVKNVQADGRFVEDKQFRVNGHDEGEVELGDHALGQFADFAGALDGGFRKKGFGLGAIESRMNAGQIIERLRDAQPARQDGDVGDEADVAHEFAAFFPRIAAEDFQLALVADEAEDGVERGGFSGAVGADEAEDAPFFDAQIHAVERNGCAVGLAKAACFDDGHGASVPPGSDFLQLRKMVRVWPSALAFRSSSGVRPRRCIVA